MKLFFNITADFIFPISHIFNQKLHPCTLSIMTLSISSRFRQHYMQRFNFIIMTHVTNEVFIVFFLSEEIFLDINMLSISTSSKKGLL